MAAVETYRGPVDGSALGVTMMHEHIFSLTPEVNANYPETWGDEEARVRTAIDELNAAKANGVDTIVDLTVVNIGRFVPRIERIAQAVGLNIIGATGVYVRDRLPLFFQNRGPGSVHGGPEVLVEFFLRDIREGMAGTRVKAGIIKCVTHADGLTPDVERTLRASAQAHRESGVPITTHTFTPPNGSDQQRVFASEGVDLSRVVIGHIDKDLRNLDYIRSLLDKGSTVGFDQFGHASSNNPTTFEDRIRTIARLCKEGYSDRIVVSHDYQSYCDMVVWETSGSYSLAATKGGPALLKAGVEEPQLRRILVENPRRILEGGPPY
ncbi:MAG: phosphotriesterase-related protein [Microbacterium sp.]